VTGIAFIQLDDDRTGSPLLAERQGPRGAHPAAPGLLDQLEKRGLAILEKTEQITNSLNNLLSPENQKIMRAPSTTSARRPQAYGDLPKQLQPTLARLPALTAKLTRP
jgi:phospholipid/cholesterol/gamma-HCH transport system substrate-binding protein